MSFDTGLPVAAQPSDAMLRSLTRVLCRLDLLNLVLDRVEWPDGIDRLAFDLWWGIQVQRGEMQ